MGMTAARGKRKPARVASRTGSSRILSPERAALSRHRWHCVFLLASLQASNGGTPARFNVLLCTGLVLPTSTGKDTYATAFLRNAAHFGSSGSASCPIASRRGPTGLEPAGSKVWSSRPPPLNLPQGAYGQDSRFPPPQSINNSYKGGCTWT